MTSLKDIKRKRNNIVKDEKQILLESYIEQYKYYFMNSINKCAYQDKYDETIKGECILLDVTNINPKNNGDEKYITTLPNSNIKVGSVLSIEFAKDITSHWIVVDKENLAIPSHDKFKLSPVYRSGKIVKCDGSEFDLDVKMENNNVKIFIKNLYFAKSMNVDAGDYWYCDDGDIYIITDVEKNLQLPFASAYRCNQTIMLKNWSEPMPCFIESNSYGSKGEIFNNAYMSDMDARAVIYVQFNNKTLNDIKEGSRFIFNHSKYDIYEITKKTSAYHIANNNGYYDLVCKYVKCVQEDDFENNIAYNSDLDNDKLDNLSLLINGDDKVNIKNSNTSIYIVENLPEDVSIIFNLDDDTIENGIAEIISSNEKSCTIRINKTKMLQLECRDRNTNKLLCYKTIYGVRK